MRASQILTIALVIIALMVLIGSVTALFPDRSVDSYDSCVAKGYPTVNYLPFSCKTPDGRVFEIQGNACALDWQCAHGTRCIQRSCR